MILTLFFLLFSSSLLYFLLVGFVGGSPGPAAILRLSLPTGTYVEEDDDPWLKDGWLLNISGTQGTFLVRINNTHTSTMSYDTHLIIALNNASYGNLVSLSVNSTSIPQSAFQYGTPKPYDIWDWPSGDVYPTWYTDTYIIGTMNPKNHRNLTISVNFFDATDARMHFDAYGSEVPPPPTKVGDLAHNPISGDSTILFWPPEEEQYYLAVETDPPGVATIPGEGWYFQSTNVSLAAPTPVPNATGVQYKFDHWDVDGTNVTGNPITVHMDANHTATAHYVKQYYLTLATNPLGITTPAGSGWHDDGAYADISTDEYVYNASDTRYRFNNWTTADMAEITNPTSPSTTVLMDKPKTVTANYVTQFLVSFNQTGLDGTATGTVVNINSTAKTFGDLPYTTWVDSGSSMTYDYSVTISSNVAGKRFSLINVTGPSSPLTITVPIRVTGNYKLQFQVIFNQSGVGPDFNGTVVTVDGTGYGVATLPKSFWWNAGSQHNFTFASPLVVDAGKRYLWLSTSGLSSLQTDTLTIASSGHVTGHYQIETKYQILFDQNGVGSDFNNTVVVVDNIQYNRDSLPVSFWWDLGSVHNFSFQSPLLVAPNSKRYLWNSTSGLSTLRNGSITVSMSGSIIGNYKTQFYLTVISPYDTPAGEDWYYSSAVAHAALDTDIEDQENGTRRVFTHWSGDASGTNFAQSDPILMDGPKTAIANWKTQYRLTVRTSGLDTYITNVYNDTALGTSTDAAPYTGWFDKDSSLQLDVDSPISDSLMRFVFTEWTGDATGSTRPLPTTMNSVKDITANYKTQFMITFDQSGVSTDFTGPIVNVDSIDYTVTDLSEQFWWDSSSTHSFEFYSPLLVAPDCKRYVWISTVGLSTLQSDSIHISGPGSVIGNYNTQYYLTLEITPPSIATPTGEGWYDDGAYAPISTTQFVDIELGASRYSFDGWTTVDMSEIADPQLASTTVLMDECKTVKASYVIQYYLVVETDPDGVATIPGEGWYDESTNVSLAAPTPVSVSQGIRYRFDYWDVDGINATGNPIAVHMNTNHTATAHYTKQYYLTVRTSPTGLSPAPTPSSNWYDESSNVLLTAHNETSLNTVKYYFNYWDVDGSTVDGNPVTVHMNMPHKATAHYTTPTPIGGHFVPVNVTRLMPYWVSYILSMTVLVAAFALVRRRAKDSKL